MERLIIASGPPSLYTTLGVTPVLGRLPTMEDEEGQVVVISHWLWSDWFGRDPEVIGNSIQVSGQPRTVVGVLPREFEFPVERTALWAHDVITPPVQPGSFNLNVIGRLAPGGTRESLAAELSALTPRILECVGGSPAYARILDAYRPVIRSLEEELVGDFAAPLWLLLGTMGIVLLIACEAAVGAGMLPALKQVDGPPLVHYADSVQRRRPCPGPGQHRDLRHDLVRRLPANA